MRTRKLRRGGQNNGRSKSAPARTRGEKTDERVIANREKRAETLISKGKFSKEAETASRRSALLIEDDIMKIHLYADMIHDHGAAVFTDLPQASKLISSTGVIDTRGVPMNEKSVVDYVLENYPAENGDVRKQNQITFQLDNETNFFPGKPVFAPFIGVPNVNVGVVQDAGIVLYRIIGATNLITFGSVLDQAGKPIEDKYWFEVPETEPPLTISSETLGFNSENVSDIVISEFKGTSVKCNFDYKFPDDPTGERFKSAGTIDGPLKLNSISGDFQSNATVKKATGETKFKLMIGKALGDALQVVSLTPMAGNYLRLGGIAKSLDGKEDRTITHAIMNTGDQLNHVRAYALGVGSVYTAPKRHGVFTCNYMPGVQAEVTPLQLFNLYNYRINDLISVVDAEYEALITHIFGLSQRFTQDESMKAGTALIPGEPGITRIKKIHGLLVQIIEVIRTYVMGYFKIKRESIPITSATATAENIQMMKEVYETLLADSTNLMPSHTSTFKQKGGKSIIEAITLCKYKGVLPGSDTPISPDIKAQIDAFAATARPVRRTVKMPNIAIPGGIRGTFVFYVSNIYQLVGKDLVVGAPYSKLFASVQIEGTTASSPDYKFGTDWQNTPSTVFGQDIEKNTEAVEPPVVGGSMTGGQEVEDEPQNDALVAFKEYVGESWKRVLGRVLSTKLQNPFSIIDHDLFEEVYGATLAYSDESARAAYAGFEAAVKTLTAMKYTSPSPAHGTRSKTAAAAQERASIHSEESLLFNEFSMHYNASIIEDYGTGYDNDLHRMFIFYRDEFRGARSAARDLLYFFENPVAGGDRTLADTSFVKHVGGQRVARANWNIDLTKSFVRSVGASPS